MPITISPLRDTIALGDTLWLTANFSDSLLEINTNTRYRITPNDIDFETGVGLFKFVNPNLTIAQQPSFTSGFTVVSKIGSLTEQAETFGRLRFYHANGQYQARIGFVARQKGVVGLNMLDITPTGIYDPEVDVSFIKLPPSVNGQPRRPTYGGMVYPINNGQTNFHLYKQHCLPISLSMPDEGTIYYEQKQTYTFVVK